MTFYFSMGNILMRYRLYRFEWTLFFTKETIPILNSLLSIPKLRISFSPSLLNIF